MIIITAKILPIATMVATLTTSINEHLRGIPHLNKCLTWEDMLDLGEKHPISRVHKNLWKKVKEIKKMERWSFSKMFVGK